MLRRLRTCIWLALRARVKYKRFYERLALNGKFERLSTFLLNKSRSYELLHFIYARKASLHVRNRRKIRELKGLAKLGNIVAKTLLRMQMFPSLAARETCVAETNFAARKQKMFLTRSQKHFCFPDTNFASETYVSQFSHPGKHKRKHCFRNNVS